MDVQRSAKKGRANYFVVIPITSPTIRAALREVQTHLETTYPTARSELRKGFTDMASAEVHITLFAIHANQARLQQVTKALAAYQTTRTRDQSFRLELKGLGSWTSKAGNIILYADLAKDSQSAVRVLAKKLRDFVLQRITEEENTRADEARKAECDVAKLSIADSPGASLPSAASSLPAASGEERKAESQQESDGKKNDNVDDENDEEEDEDEEDEDEEEDDDDDDDDDDEDEEEEDEKSEDPEEDFPGLWFDDPRPDIYIPHVTVLNSDPSWDRKLRMQLADKGQAKGGRAKAAKRGGGARARAAAEPFGWDYNLFRGLRSTYAKFSFGAQTVDNLELQSDFVCLLPIPLR